VQDTFIDVQKAFADFHGRTVNEACSWLRKIYLRKVSHYYRRFVDVEKRKVAKEIPLDSPRGQVEMRHIAESTSDFPLNTAIQHEEDQRFRAAFNQLSPEHQRVIYLHVFEKRPFRDIGPEFGCIEAAAQQLCARAMRKLARLVDPDRPNGKQHRR
jgi:RNA polymerase sigma factor (sigma-70 family)